MTCYGVTLLSSTKKVRIPFVPINSPQDFVPSSPPGMMSDQPGFALRFLLKGMSTSFQKTRVFEPPLPPKPRIVRRPCHFGPSLFHQEATDDSVPSLMTPARNLFILGEDAPAFPPLPLFTLCTRRTVPLAMDCSRFPPR